jgi:hypothetical protein
MIAERRAKEGSLTERGPTNDGLLRIDLDGNDDAGGSLDDLPSPEPVPSLATYLDERERCLARSAACRANFSAYVNDASATCRSSSTSKTSVPAIAHRAAP